MRNYWYSNNNNHNNNNNDNSILMYFGYIHILHIYGIFRGSLATQPEMSGAPGGRCQAPERSHQAVEAQFSPDGIAFSCPSPSMDAEKVSIGRSRSSLRTSCNWSYLSW